MRGWVGEAEWEGAEVIEEWEWDGGEKIIVR